MGPPKPSQSRSPVFPQPWSMPVVDKRRLVTLRPLGTGLRHAGWGPVGVECHLGWSQILVGRFPCNGYEHIQIYKTTTKNGMVFCMMCNQTAFSIQKNNHRSFHTHGTGTLTAILSSGCVVDDLFKNTCGKHHDGGLEPTMENTSIPWLVAFTRRLCSLNPNVTWWIKLDHNRKNSATPLRLAYSGPRVASSDFLLCPQLAGGHWRKCLKISKLCHLVVSNLHMDLQSSCRNKHPWRHPGRWMNIHIYIYIYIHILTVDRRNLPPPAIEKKKKNTLFFSGINI